MSAALDVTLEYQRRPVSCSEGPLIEDAVLGLSSTTSLTKLGIEKMREVSPCGSEKNQLCDSQGVKVQEALPPSGLQLSHFLSCSEKSTFEKFC